MIREIIHDPLLLAQPAELAVPDDLQTAIDLLDTLKAHADSCVGMAANMIGVNKRIIVYQDGARYATMFNPQIVQQKGKLYVTEGCLSLSGVRETVRAAIIKVRYEDERFHPHYGTFAGFTAQIIQHEIDHCNGILI